MENRDLSGQGHVRRFLSSLYRDPRARKTVARLVNQGYFNVIPILAEQLRYPTPLTTADARAVLDPNGEIDDLTAFFNRLRTNDTLRRTLSQLSEGDYAGVVDVARREGLVFTVDEFRARLPEGFYKGSGARPDLGWTRDA